MDNGGDSSFPLGLLGRKPGKGTFLHRFFRPVKDPGRVIPLRAGFVHAFADSAKVHDSAPQAADGVVGGNVVFFQGFLCFLIFGLGKTEGLLRVPGGELLFQLRPPLVGAALSEKGIPPLLQFLRFLAAFSVAAVQELRLGDLFLHLPELGFQKGDLPGLIVAAAVELTLELLHGLGVGSAFFPGGDELGDALFQAPILTDGKTCLADKGAALIYLPADAKKGLAAVFSGQFRDHGAGSGIHGPKLRHRRAGTAGGAEKGKLLSLHGAVDPAQHGGAGPGGVTVFFGKRAGLVPLTAVDAVKHGGQKGAPGGLAGLIGRLDNVEAFVQLQGLALEFAEIGAHTMDLHGITSLVGLDFKIF